MSIQQFIGGTGGTGNPTLLDVTLANIASNTVAVIGPAWGVTTDNKPVFLPAGSIAPADNGDWDTNPNATDFGKQLISQPSKRFAQDLLSVPLPYAAFTLTMTQADWRKAAKFTYTNTTAPTAAVSVGNGATHVKLLRWDGTFSAVKAISGNTSILAGDWGAAPASPYNTAIPKFGAIVPCDVSGNVTGDLTTLSLTNNQLTSFDATRLGSLIYLSLSSNRLTSFDATGLGSLTILYISYNQLTSFAGTGLGSLTTLDLSNNQLTSFDATGLGSLTTISLGNNQLTSFAGTGLGSLDTLYLINNQLTSFDATGLGSLTSLSLTNNQLTSFDATGLGSLDTFDIYNNQLTSLLLPVFTGSQPYTWASYALDLSNQQLDTDAVYLLLDSITSPAADQPYPINLVGNPCDDTVTAGPNLVDGATYTAAQVEALLTVKGYELQVTGGTITG